MDTTRNVLSRLLLVAALLMPLAGKAQTGATVPYNCDFESSTERASWMLLNDTLANAWVVDTAANNTTGGSMGLYISCDTGRTNGYNDTLAAVTYACRRLSLTAGSYGLTFDWRAQGEQNADYLMALLVPATDDTLLVPGTMMPAGLSLFSLPEGWINAGPQSGGRYALQLNGEWSRNAVQFTVDSTADYLLVFCWRNDASVGSNPAAAVDNISLRLITCFPPTDFIVTQDINALTLNWTPGASETSWLVTYDSTTVTASIPQITLNNLEANTIYHISVRSYCGEGDTSDATSLTTGTGVTIPYFENFDSLPEGLTFHPAWRYTLTGDPAYATEAYAPQVVASQLATSGDYSLQLRGFGLTMLPKVGAPTNALQVRFTHRVSSNNGARLDVGVMEGGTFVPIETIDDPMGVHQKTVYLMNYTGTSRTIAFRNWSADPNATSAYHYIDDLLVDWLPSCYPVAGTTTVADSVSATISWTPQMDATQWIVDIYDMDSNLVYNDLTTDSSVAVTDLDANTIYRYSVRSYCGVDDTSEAVGGTFRTKCTALPLPYADSFETLADEDYENGYVNSCWRLYSNGGFTPSTTGNAAHSGNRSLRFTAGATTYSYAVLPLLEGRTDTLLVSFWARQSGTTAARLLVGVMTNPDDLNTFVTVDTCLVAGDAMRLFEIPLSTYAGTGRNIAIVCDSAAGGAYVDDLLVEVIPSCSRVKELATGEVTAGAAELGWTQGLFGNYEGAAVEYRPEGEEDWLGEYEEGTAHLLTDLNYNTAYEVRVAAVCENSDSSEFVYLTLHTSITNCLQIDSSSSVTDTVAGFSTTARYDMPVNNWYPYSFTEQLYTADELDTAGSISAISFLYAADSLYTMTAKDSVEIYLGATEMESISLYNFIGINQMTKVYSGSLNCAPGWNTFAFNEGFFNYDGRSNLVVAVVDRSGANDSSTYRFSTHSASGKTVTFFSENYTYDDYLLMSRDDPQYRNDMVLHLSGCEWESDCKEPTVRVTAIGSDSVSVTLVPGAHENSWFMYRQALGTTMAYDGNATGLQYTFGALTPSTTYTFRVISDCEDRPYTEFTVTTKCEARSLPYTEDFSTWPSGPSPLVPSCWYKSNTSGGSNIPYVVNYMGHGDNRSMYLYSAASNRSLLALPEFDTPIDSLQISFWMYRPYSQGANYNHSLLLGVIGDVEDYSTFTVIDTVSPSQYGQWAYFEIPLDSYEGPAGRLAFVSPDSVLCYPNIDDIEVKLIPRCQHITGLHRIFGGAGADTLTLGWDFAPYTLGYIVNVGDDEYFTTQNQIDIPGLQPNSLYTVSVRKLCGEADSLNQYVWTDTSEAVSGTYRTACGAISQLPWTESFEGNAVSGQVYHDFAICWTRHNDAQYYFGQPYVDNTAHSGSLGLSWTASTDLQGAGNYQLIVSPQIDTTALPINTLQVSFWARAESTTMTPVFQVGVMSDATNPATFVPVDTVTINGISSWRKYIVYLDRYTADSGSYIAIKSERPGTTWSAQMDDIEINHMPACPLVSNIEAIDVDSNMLLLTWHENGNATAWDIEYGPTGFTPGNGQQTMAYAIPFQLGGLNKDTEYDIYVKPYCSEVVDFDMATIRTAGTYYGLPHYSSFSNADTNSWWTLRNGGLVNQWYIGNAVPNSDNGALYISNNGGTSWAYNTDSTTICYAYIDVRIPQAGYYSYSYDWKSRGQSGFDFMRAALVPVNYDLTGSNEDIYVGFSSTTLPVDWIAIDSGSQRYNSWTEWNHESEEVYVATPGVYHLTFVWQSYYIAIGHQPPAAVDNVSLRPVTCHRPTDLNCEVGSNEVTVSWTTYGDEWAWIVTCGDSSVMAYTTSCTINGLLSNTDYTVTVRAYCGDGDTSLAATMDIHTECLIMNVPYYTNFDTITTIQAVKTHVLMPCWHFIMTGTSVGNIDEAPQLSYYPAGANSGNYSLRIAGLSYTILPSIDRDVTEVELSFSHFTTGDYTLIVGIMEMEDSTFIPIQTISDNADQHVTHTINFYNYTGNGRHIAFYNTDPNTITGLSYHFVDDIAIEPIATCLPVSNIHSNQASTTSIDLDWTDATAAQGWQVEYGLAGFTQGSGTMLYTTSHPFTVSGLDSLTAYAFYVRPICDSADTAVWAGPVSISTPFCDEAFAATTGTGSTSSYYLPVNNGYEFSLSEMIVNASELAGSGEISAVAFYYNYNQPISNLDSVDIYIQPTTRSTFSTVSDMEALNATTAVHVYSGALDAVQGWNYYTFDTPYSWDGVSNLMVIVDDNSGQHNTTNHKFRTAPCIGNKSLTYYSYTENPDPTNPGAFSGNRTMYSHRPMMQLISCGHVPCQQPGSLMVGNIGADTADLTWIGSGTDYEIAVKDTNDADWPVATLITTTVGNGSYTLTGLDEHTAYDVRIRQVCDDNLYSYWTTTRFTTEYLPCPAPTGLTASNATLNSVDADWTAGNESSTWYVHVWNTAFDSTYIFASHPVTVTGLAQDLEYSMNVYGVCEYSGLQSGVSNTVTFATTSCQPVSDVRATNVSASSVAIAWNGSAAKYSIEYGPTGFGQGTGTTINNITTTSYTINGLESDTQYDLYVRAWCTDDQYSTWSPRLVFNTTQGIHDAGNGPAVSIFPNPASTDVTVELTGFSGAVSLLLVDINGRTIREFDTRDTKSVIDVSDLPAGAYFLRINSGESSITRRLIVK